MRRWLMAWGAVAAVIAVACGAAEGPQPVAVGQEACAFCRMTISQRDFASQVVAPGELPKFFDDLGCLRQYLTATPPGTEPAAIYVTDRRTKEWVPAALAVFSRVDALSTPMGSHLVAHASAESRAADPEAAAGVAVAPSEVLPDAWRSSGGGQ